MVSGLPYRFSLIFILVIIVACGEEGSKNDFAQQQDQRQEGRFEAFLESLNSNSTQGSASFVLSDDSFSANIKMENANPGSTYPQYVMAGEDCLASPVLIPLDNVLSDQEAGGIYPTSDSGGQYSYQSEASIEEMIQDLRTPDTNDNDNLIKLSPDERGLNMEGRSILITRLQGTEEIPVACGPIIRSPF